MDRRNFAKSVAGHLVFCWAAGTLLTPEAARAAEMDRTIAFYAHQSTDLGLRFLRTQQGTNGSWENDIGMTALALRAFATSYRQYTVNDGPFMSKPLSWLMERLGGSENPDLGDVATANLAEAITTLRLFDAARRSDMIKRLQADLAARRPDVADLGPHRAQSEIFLVLVALAGNQSDAANAFRSFAGKAIAALQLPNGGFPGSDGTEILSMTSASAVGLSLTLQDDFSDQMRAALDRVVATFGPNISVMGRDDPPYFVYDALQAGMTRAERGGNLGEAETWRNTFAYALLEVQGEDGGWLPDGAVPDRIAATGRAVNAINKVLPPG